MASVLLEPELPDAGADDAFSDRERPRVLRSDLPDAPLGELLGTIERHRGSDGDLDGALQALAGRFLASNVEARTAAAATAMVLADLAAQGWSLDVARSAVWMKPPSNERRAGESPAAVKARFRAPMEAARQRQLAEPSVARFVASMVAPRRHGDRVVSIADVIDDGADLAQALADVAALPEAERATALSNVVDPVVEPVTADGRCAHTGLPLRDIWRFFRHTWSLEYRPTPGRNAQVLIRNRARANAPIIGIGALTNPVLNLYARDRWIGWSHEAVTQRLAVEPSLWSTLRPALLDLLEAARAEVRIDDLGALEGRDPELVERELAAIVVEAGNERAAVLAAQEQGTIARDSGKSLPRTTAGDVDWQAASAAPLFRAKRARAFGEIFAAERRLRAAPDDGAAFLAAVAADSDLDRALRIALRKLRERGLSSRILEINVCGAAPPYRELLGGKLVALMLMSAEVRSFYQDRYRGMPGEIASKMAGRPIVRDNDVCLLTTTSLYGVGSSQYNRLRIEVPGHGMVRYDEIGITDGQGTLHFRDATVKLLRQVSIERRGHRHVNNVFGEGTSPLLRQIREGLSKLRFKPRDVIQHSWPRIIYAAELYAQARDDLLLDRPSSAALASAAEIGAAWRQRWLVKRIANADVLARVAAQQAMAVARDVNAAGPTAAPHDAAGEGVAA